MYKTTKTISNIITFEVSMTKLLCESLYKMQNLKLKLLSIHFLVYRYTLCTHFKNYKCNKLDCGSFTQTHMCIIKRTVIY